MTEQVSIPFIAGQWSLPRRRYPQHLCHREVSIPFIAGQWSLQIGATPAPWRASRFQSPSLRGSGRFPYGGRGARRSAPGFNPLHCGAVVASGALVQRLRHVLEGFNPLHCGAVVAS